MQLKYLYILLFALLSLSVQSQQHEDAVGDELSRRAVQCDSVGVDSCAKYAEDWVAALPQEELLFYARQAEKVLYRPYPSYCNRVMYRTLLGRLLQDASDDVALLRYKYQYEMLCRNNEGDCATDFVYYDVDGKEHSLSDSRGARTLLIFNDPECEECAALRNHIITTGGLAGCVVDSTTTVLLVYPDEPTDAWREAVMHYPSTWIVGYSEDVSDLYDLRTLPSTYWLDEEQRIMKRDAHQ